MSSHYFEASILIFYVGIPFENVLRNHVVRVSLTLREATGKKGHVITYLLEA